MDNVHGISVSGPTFPADIWHDMMTSIIAIDHARHPNQKDTTTGEGPSATGTSADWKRSMGLLSLIFERGEERAWVCFVGRPKVRSLQ